MATLEYLNMLTEEQMQKMRDVSSKGMAQYQRSPSAISSDIPKKSTTSKPAIFDPMSGINANIGIAKGAISTLTGASSLGERFLKGLGRLVTPKQFEGTLGFQKFETEEKTSAEKLVPESIRTPVGGAQKLGFGAEQIAEFFIPVAGQEKALAIGANLAKEMPAGLKTITKLAPLAAKESVEFGGKTAVQTGGDTEATKNAMLLGALTPVGAEILSSTAKAIFPKLSKFLEEINLRLTPTQKQNLGKRLDEVTAFLSQKKIIGSPKQRTVKINEITSNLEDKFQAFLTTEASSRTVPKEQVISELERLKQIYKVHRDSATIERQIDGAIDVVKNNLPDQISVTDLNKLKRSTFDNAYNEAGNKVINDVEYDIADVFKNNVEKGTEGLKIDGKDVAQFNKEYGVVINAKKLLKIAETRKQIGLIGNLISLSAGSAIGGAIGGPAGYAAGAAISTPLAKYIAGTGTRSTVSAGSQIMNELLSNPEAMKGFIKVIAPSLIEYISSLGDEPTR